MIDFEITQADTEDSRFPVVVHCYDKWLDGSTYYRRDKMRAWLEDNGIEFEQDQNIKQFIWRFTAHEDAMLFALRWS